MDARGLIQIVSIETLLEIVGRLTNGTADPQFVRAAAMEIKRGAYENIPGESTKPAMLPGK